MESEAKYKVGEKVIVNTWTGKTEPLEILETKITWHPRMQEECWGYRLNGNHGLTFTFVPEGYLIKI